MRIQAAAPKFGDSVTTDLKAVHTVGDDRLAAGQLLRPCIDGLSAPALGPRQHVGALRETVSDTAGEHHYFPAAPQSRAQLFGSDRLRRRRTRRWSPVLHGAPITGRDALPVDVLH